MTHIGQGFYGITKCFARQLCGGRSPKLGREKLVETPAGGYMWCSVRIVNGKEMWTVREAAGWKLVNGVATLGGAT